MKKRKATPKGKKPIPPLVFKREIPADVKPEEVAGEVKGTAEVVGKMLHIRIWDWLKRQ